jgi:hypothetical protein
VEVDVNIFAKIQNSSLLSYLKGKSAKKQTAQKSKDETVMDAVPKRDDVLSQYFGSKHKNKPGRRSKAQRRKIKAIAYESKRYNFLHCK